MQTFLNLHIAHTGRASTKKNRYVRKLEEDSFEDWKAGTELGGEGFKQIMLVGLQRSVHSLFSL